ncbi:MAG TPA: 50S ribosomal protein L11 methyltransferase [Saprospiraceae bacterium]|nr:50S ribosomal protein L11 methyltransferase [Saprospiraceae bacterium]HND87977.1 50S ribosomal protein L11 methyltransferase [Saprospiraceae bacterium]HNG89641.1 50S ribosomal protein L11 methyltransferase [Saprospiraceae bacterium]
MDYWKYDLRCTPDTAELLLAFLGDGPFDTFEEMETGLHAYCPKPPGSEPDQEPEEALALLRDLKERFEFGWEATFIPGQNWNTLWESNFQPVEVNDFCAVRADFHPPMPGFRWELVINPKMAFGTGHHETTWQCIAAMEHLPVQGAKVLDFGCGTGILAILAAKLGAAEVEAVDIEEESYRNTVENAERNAATNITARCGTLDQVQGRDFDGILANINRNVILDALPRLASIIRPTGWLLVSGILQEDGATVRHAAAQAGFEFHHGTQRGNWLCMVFRI